MPNGAPSLQDYFRNIAFRNAPAMNGYTTGGGFGTPPTMPGLPGPLDLIPQPPPLGDVIPLMLGNPALRPMARTTGAPTVPRIMPPEGVAIPETAALEEGTPVPRSLSAAAAGERGLNTAGMPENVQTPEFRNWFGNSQVVDEEGSPRGVYHVTDDDFTTFDIARGGDFTRSVNDEPTAIEMARLGIWSHERPLTELNLKNTMELYYRLENPAYLGWDDTAALIRDHGSAEAVRQLLMSEGYDGIVLDDKEFGGWSYIAFDPTQVKSIHNPGTFNPNNPDIMAQARGPLSQFLRQANA